MSDNDRLQPYLPRLIRYWDEDAPGRLHRSIEASMVFVDVSGFTKMSERLARHGNVGAEEVTDVIDTTFGTLLPEAYAYGANLLKFGGDALLLMFSGQGHAARAAAAAHAMRAKLRDVGTFQTTAGKVSLRMSVGAHTGQFDFFLVGGSHRELIVAGPAATRTVEMEAAANANQILISPEMAAMLPSSVLGAEVGQGRLLRRPPQAGTSDFRSATSPPTSLEPFIPVALRPVLTAERVEPEHRPAAVAFLHYENLDRLIMEQGAAEAASRLDALVRSVQAAADDHEVTFLATDIAPDGGKIILTAGVPETRGNDEERLLLALRAIVESAPGGLPVQIGVNRGAIFSGAVGPWYRRTYTVMGDVVNLAARLMAKAPTGEIYATEDVVHASRTLFALTRPEPFYVKGKASAIQALSVGAPQGTRTSSGAMEIPLVGREDELTTLEEAWSSASAGRGRVVELAAEVGMGKSRLLEAFLGRAKPPLLIETECRLYQSSTPYFPFQAWLRSLWGLSATTDADNIARLEHLVESRAPELTPWLALLGPTLDLDISESREVAQLEDQYRPSRTLTVVRELMAATTDTPCVVVVEDTQWMDEASAELLGGLIASVDDQPWLFILTRRPGDDGFVAVDLEGVSRIDLLPLTQEAAKAFIIRATAASPLLPHQVDTLVERAEGRPLFLLEMADAVCLGGDVEALPGSIEGLIASRIDRLPPSDRSFLRRLAVLGAGFRFEYMDAVLREEERAGKAAQLRRVGEFLTSDGTGWIEFANTLIRDVAYAGLPFRTRLELHARVGDSILAAAGDEPESEAALLSLHYFEARRWAEAWHYSRVAGEAARSVYANHAAATFYRRALAASRHLDLGTTERSLISQALGDVLEQAGLYDDALQAYKRAMALADDDDLRAELLLKRAQVKMRQAAYPQALRDATAGLQILDGAEETCSVGLRAQLLAFRSTVRMAQQRPMETLRLAEEAVRCAEVSDEDAALARAYANIDWANFVTGQPERATNSPKSVEIYESLGMLDRAADVLNNMGGFAYYMGDWNESIRRISESRQMSLRAGNDVQAAMAGVNLGELLVSQRKLDEAAPILEESIRTLRAAGDRDNAVNAELQQARLLAAGGDDEGARVLLRQVVDEALELGQIQFAYEATLYLAELKVAAGHATEAMEDLRRATARVGDEAEFFEPKRARVAALAYAALNQAHEALEEIASGLEAADAMGLLYDEALLRSTRLDLMEQWGRPTDPTDRETTRRLLDRLGVEQAATV